MATGVRSSILDEVVLGKGSEFVIKKMRGRHPQNPVSEITRRSGVQIALFCEGKRIKALVAVEGVGLLSALEPVDDQVSQRCSYHLLGDL
jgi:hypothetical protein